MPIARSRPSAKLALSVYRTLHRAYGPRHWWPGDTPFEIIVGALLTQNTAWVNVEMAIRNLKNEGLLTPRAMHRAPVRRLAAAIRPAGYFNVKARRLKNFLAFLRDETGDSMDLRRMFRRPWRQLRDSLLTVNGIGPETADSIVLYAAGLPSFVVDAYTRRLFSRLGAVPEGVSYEDLRAYFMDRLPVRAPLYNEYHALIVEHAKRHCRPRPLCESCPLTPSCRSRRFYN